MRPTGVFLVIEESAGVFTPARDDAVKLKRVDCRQGGRFE
jgi:hypothetical protein